VAAEAGFIVNLTSWQSDLGDVLLPIAPFTETAGTFVSTEGRVQSFQASVLPLGEARPAWKVLRVLGTMLGRPGFEFDTIEQVRSACLEGKDVAALLSNRIEGSFAAPAPAAGLQRIADVPIYFADPLVRRAPSLQKTRDARAPRAWMNARLMRELGLAEGQPVRVTQGAGAAQLPAALDDRLPEGCVRVAAAHPSTAGLGPMFGTVQVAKAATEKAA
jgi:NADH-quinone oxidoreductase subunit G